MQQFAELAKSSVIGIGETRLDGYVLNNEIIIVKNFQANPTLLIVQIKSLVNSIDSKR